MSTCRRPDVAPSGVFQYILSIFFGEQLFLAARRAHDKMAVLLGPIRCGLARLVRTVGAWNRGSLGPTPSYRYGDGED